MIWLYLVFTFLFLSQMSLVNSDQKLGTSRIKIGAIMTEFNGLKRTRERATLEYAVNRLNKEYARPNDIEFEAKLIILPSENSYRSLKYGKFKFL